MDRAMGIFDFLSGSPEKRIKSLQKKITEKYGPPENRQKALDQLIEMGSPEAIGALVMRFTVNTEPSITDADEKEYTYKSILEFGEKAVGPVEAFLRRRDVATSWAVRMLSQLIPETDLVSLLIDVLEKLGPEYTRDPEKKTVLLSTLGEHKDERIPPALIPFLEDPSDDVRIAAAVALGKQNDERAREPLLKAFVESSDRARVIAAITTTLADTGFGVQGFREKVEKGLPDGFFVDRSGVVKRRE
jgi:hypothetical protein